MANESEQVTPVDSIEDVLRSSMKVPEFDKHLKKAGWHIGRNVVEITIKMKTIVRKRLMIIIIKLHLRNLDNSLIKINKTSLNKINFAAAFWNAFNIFSPILPPVKFFSFENFSTTCSFSYCLYKCIRHVIVVVISLFFHSKMDPAGTERTKNCGAFSN